MASSYDYFLLGDHAAARAAMRGALEAQGFTITETPTGGFFAKRGSTARTVWLGAMAGSKFVINLAVDFMTDAQGLLVARLHRDMTSGALLGGAIGAAKTATIFGETGDAVANDLVARQVLAHRIDNA
ncbi:hypothetical protein [Agromyces mediolanus]|jgi:hypothetical protein|uniref:hypothetical protein n=1 Tax=Agromyces mediolanus TaxID=41986 RepID=UPI001E638D6B|nr:hypothetical protein [Agromyces mediolanus]MCD1569829.1 hypothetical protein [Agromyces mediolanus]